MIPPVGVHLFGRKPYREVALCSLEGEPIRNAPQINAVAQVLTAKVSPTLAAILDHALNAQHPRTSPRLVSLAITEGGWLVAWSDRDPLTRRGLGAVSAFERNLRGVCATCGLTQDEAEAVVDFAYSRISDWRIWGRRGANPFREVR